MAPLDLVILNAGTCEYIDEPRRFDGALFERVLRSNLLGMAYCLEAFLPLLKSGGQLVIVSSSVTRLPLPRAEAYGASKAGLSYLAKTLACDLKDIDVTLVEPGFVDTPLTEKNDFSMPFRVSPQTAVERIVRGIEKRKAIVRFPGRFMLLLNLLRLLPFSWWKSIMRGVRR